MVQLPSGKLLQYHKNVVSQPPGINESVIKWMVDEAKRKSIDTAGKVGGLILDEMAIHWYLTYNFPSNVNCITQKSCFKFISTQNIQ